jgi:hypothetical protein
MHCNTSRAEYDRTLRQYMIGEFVFDVGMSTALGPQSLECLAGTVGGHLAIGPQHKLLSRDGLILVEILAAAILESGRVAGHAGGQSGQRQRPGHDGPDTRYRVFRSPRLL